MKDLPSVDEIVKAELPDDVFPSSEEMYFYWWAYEMYKLGYIKQIDYQPKAYHLSDKVDYKTLKKLKTKDKIIDTHLLHSHVYTPDFKIHWTLKGYNKVYCVLGREKANKDAYFKANIDKDGNIFSVIEVKGSFDMNNMTRLASINIKWVYQMYGEYVQVVIPTPSITKKGKVKPVNALYYQTFVPLRFYYTDKKNDFRKIKFTTRKINEYLQLIN